jgi:hypothetical protein
VSPGASLAAALGLLASSARAAPGVTIEKATVPWSELEQLMRRESAPPRRASPPSAYAIRTEIDGLIEEGRVTLEVQAEVTVLEERQWVVAPLFPPSLAIASASVEAPEGHTALLVRGGDGVAFAAQGRGRYRLRASAEGPLEPVPGGARLALAPPRLSGGQARIRVRGAQRIAGRTAWKVERAPSGELLACAAMGEGGLELRVLGAEPRSEAGTALEELRAVTVLSLGGSGVTRLTLRAAAEEGGVDLVLPQGARLWRAYVGGVALKLGALGSGGALRLPLRGPAIVELAYTFDGAPLGIRGRFRVELPRLSAPVRDARWSVYLPDGLRYRETQAALAASTCAPEESARTPLSAQGLCFGFARPVLEPGCAYVEGVYEQPL